MLRGMDGGAALAALKADPDLADNCNDGDYHSPEGYGVCFGFRRIPDQTDRPCVPEWVCWESGAERSILHWITDEPVTPSRYRVCQTGTSL